MSQSPLAPPPPTGGPIDGWLYLLWKRLINLEQGGTWTPSPTGFTTVSGTPVWTGTYTKVGDIVVATAAWTGGVLTSPGGAASYFSGLDYVPDLRTPFMFISSGITQGATGLLYETGVWYAPAFTNVGAGYFTATFKTT